MTLQPQVVVFGSLNMDLVTRAHAFPAPGETLTGQSFQMTGGGKGGNQALASAKLGVRTALIGRVGRDAFGPALLEELRAGGVEVSGVRLSDSPTGTASVQLASDGENTIVVVPGANHDVNAGDLEVLNLALEGAALLLLQLELPLPLIVQAAGLATQHGVRVILDPAPAVPMPAELYRACWLLTPNEREAELLTGRAVSTAEEVEAAAHTLIGRGARQVIVKRGRAGTYWTDGASSLHWPAQRVTAVDTVAAGDAFNGGLAAALAQGLDISAALAWGTATAAVAVTRPGAQASLPDRQEMLHMLSQAELGPSHLTRTPA